MFDINVDSATVLSLNLFSINNDKHCWLGYSKQLLALCEEDSGQFLKCFAVIMLRGPLTVSASLLEKHCVSRHTY